MPNVVQNKAFSDNAGILQRPAETDAVNAWVAAIQGGMNAFDAGNHVHKEIKKLQGTPSVAKGGTHELVVGQVNRVFFKYDTNTVTLTNVGHT